MSNEQQLQEEVKERVQPYYKHSSYKGFAVPIGERPLEKYEKPKPLNKEEQKKHDKQKAELKTEKLHWKQAQRLRYGSDYKSIIRQTSTTVKI